jgi:hypothetical protein
MDYLSNRNTRATQARREHAVPSVAPAQPKAVSTASTQRSAEPAKDRKPRRRLPLIIGLIIGIGLLIALGLNAYRYTTAAPAIDSGKFQVVVLRDALNTPNYFGKLSVVNSDYFRLTNVFYLKKKSDGSSASSQAVESQAASDFELIKMGDEIHGPEDEIIIPRDQVLYFENLKPGGTVSKTITEFQKKNK